MRIAFITAEAVPFAKVGGLADVCGTLPLALERLGHEVVLIMPRYRQINAGVDPLMDGVYKANIGKDIQCLFLDQPELFDRDGIYGTTTGDHPDNLERFSFLCRQALQVLHDLNKPVDIVHCHDWHTGLVPVYLQAHWKDSPVFKNTKSIFTIHNLAYQGLFPKEEFSKLELDESYFTPEGFWFYDQISFMKAGLVFSDYLTTVSHQYAQEIQTEPFGCGLDHVLRQRKDKLIGILNGIDYEEWNPETDPHIKPNYSAKNAKLKNKHKSRLQKAMGLPKKDVPLFGFVGRLCYQKGFDLMAQSVEELVKRSLQVAFVGVGDAKYQDFVESIAKEYPQQIAAHLNFNETMAHQIYAGSDFFLMPSVYEPCGLGQMISLAYGTIPLVYSTGGLADTIEPYNSVTREGNGIVFKEYNNEEFLQAIDRAIEIYEMTGPMKDLVDKAFTYQFTWEDSARQYSELYQRTD